jgi:hypothetical protein
MSLSRSALLTACAAAAGFTVGASGLAIAYSMGMHMKGPEAVAELSNNEAVYVDKATFKLRLGTSKGDPIAHIAKAGGQEVASGAIIVRTGDKLYIVDGKPTD